jgi:peptide/nickel transport system substrate-binding protein
MQKRSVIHNLFLLFTGGLFFALLSGCGGIKREREGTVLNIQIPSDPDMLNPFCYNAAESAGIIRFIFQSLTDIDTKTLELVPVLAVSRAIVEKTQNGHLKYTYSLRPEAKWDNGAPITAKDVEFSLKAIKNPKVNDPQIKSGYDHLVDFVYDSSDPLKFTLIFDENYMLSEIKSGDYAILPEYFYDPKGLMRNFTLKQLTEEKEKLGEDPRINEFAKDFNSEKRMREKEYISGSGPYKFEQWITGRKVVLIRKENWWGDHFKETDNMFFDNNPSQLNYKIINDQTAAITALKAGDIDVMHGIKPKDFFELTKSEKMKTNFNTYTPATMGYFFLGLNTKHPVFSDRRTREAIAHLVDVNKLIETVMYGYARPTIGPISPSNTKSYNSSIKPYDYNPEKAKQLLSESGWKDSNSDGILDKTIAGKHTEFIVDYLYSSGNDTRKQIGLLLQEEARKVGIRINVVAQDFSVCIENFKKHNFDIMSGGWVSSPVLPDFKQIYHSESALNEGSNFCSFGTAESDSLIDAIRTELNEEKRNAMYMKLQQILHDEVVNIFLYNPCERIAIQKRFTNTNISVMRPGYYEAGFRVEETN